MSRASWSAVRCRASGPSWVHARCPGCVDLPLELMHLAVECDPEDSPQLDSPSLLAVECDPEDSLQSEPPSSTEPEVEGTRLHALLDEQQQQLLNFHARAAAMDLATREMARSQRLLAGLVIGTAITATLLQWRRSHR